MPPDPDFSVKRLPPGGMYDLNDRRVHYTDYEEEGNGLKRTGYNLTREHTSVLNIAEERLVRDPSNKEEQIKKACMLYNLVISDLYKHESEDPYPIEKPAYPTQKAVRALEWFLHLEKTIPVNSEPDLKAKLIWLKGKLLLILHRYEEAITAFNASFALTIKRNPGWAYFKRGQAWRSYPKDTPASYKQWFDKKCWSDLKKAREYYPSDEDKQRWCSNTIFVIEDEYKDLRESHTNWFKQLFQKKWYHP